MSKDIIAKNFTDEEIFTLEELVCGEIITKNFKIRTQDKTSINISNFLIISVRKKSKNEKAITPDIWWTPSTNSYWSSNSDSVYNDYILVVHCLYEGTIFIVDMTIRDFFNCIDSLPDKRDFLNELIATKI